MEIQVPVKDIQKFCPDEILIAVNIITLLMQLTGKMGCAEALVKILEKEGVKFIFGHPGEQILPFYDALRTSSIEHVLMRHEQGAAHAADGYARASAQPGVCIASAGPGALNLVMGVATAYRDSIPLLVITGDVPQKLRGGNVFQEIDIPAIFSPITLKSWNIEGAEEAVLEIKEALKMLKQGRTGPLHLNLPRDVLQKSVDSSMMDMDISYSPENDWSQMDQANNLIETSKRPLILAGAGVIWSKAVNHLKLFSEDHQFPLATTYPGRGVISEDHPLSLGMLGLRGTESANFAGKNADLIIALGCRFSERTMKGVGESQIIQVNLNRDFMIGDVQIQGDVGEFLRKINHLPTENTDEWLTLLRKYPKSYDIKTDYEQVPLKPQRAIKEIMDASPDSIMVNDAGSHTTWVTLLRQVREPSSLIFSGGFGPMGYGVPAAVGVSLARPDKSVVVVVGDGGFQMTSQELATISELELPVVICLINNSSLGIIKQWQELYYHGSYQVELENPDFVKLAEAYGLEAERVDNPGDVFPKVSRLLKLNKPGLIEILVDKDEGIPLPW
jgi:acetolactate synthase-1/2/3 large subunit